MSTGRPRRLPAGSGVALGRRGLPGFQVCIVIAGMFVNSHGGPIDYDLEEQMPPVKLPDRFRQS